MDTNEVFNRGDSAVEKSHNTPDILPEEYGMWKAEIVSMIEKAKYQAAINVNAEMLALYWKIGVDILKKQQEQGWGAQVVEQLSHDLSKQFPDDRGFSQRNLRNMKKFAQEYPDFPFLQVPLAKIKENDRTYYGISVGDGSRVLICRSPIPSVC